MKTETCRVVIFLLLARCQGSKDYIKSKLLGRTNVDAGTEFDHLKTVVEREKIYGVPENVESVKFQTPVLSDEEERSPHLPTYLHCDACLGVAHQIALSLAYAHRHIPIERDIPEWEVQEAIDTTCQYENFVTYGLTEDSTGKHRIRGPGVEGNQDSDGRISQLGGKWPGRLVGMCLQITGIFMDTEMEIYRAFKMSDSKYLGDLLCRNSKIRGLDACMKSTEQGKIDRTEIDAMLKTFESKGIYHDGEL